MIELLRVALRSIGVVLPGAGVLGLVELRGGADAEGFGSFLGAMGLSLLACAIWSAMDARHASASRVFARWAAIAFVVAGGIAFATTLLAPGSPPGAARVADAIQMSMFYGVPLLVVAGLGVAVGAGIRSEEAKARDNAGAGLGH